MELINAIESRYSCRKFKNKELDDDILKSVVKMGSLAPSINNSQPWKFIVIKDKVLLNEMAEKVLEETDRFNWLQDSKSESVKKQIEWFSTFFKDAPAVIAVMTGKYETRISDALEDGTAPDLNEMRNYPDIQSLGACVQNILLTAHGLGLGSCWLSAPVIASNEISKILEVDSSEWRIGAMIAVGEAANPGKPVVKNEAVIEFR